VGDTVTVVRTIAAPADVRARAQPLGSSLLIEPLADPLVYRNSQGIAIRYTFATFEAGRHPVEVPPVEMVYRDGRVALLPGDTAWVTVRSLLPQGDSLPEPKASLGPVARYPTRLAPLGLLVGLVMLGTGTWVAARRRVRPRTGGIPSVPPAGPPPLMRWIAAGEGRAVAAVAAERLRNRIAQLLPEAGRALSVEECIAVLEEHRTDWPVRDMSELLRALERARFAPAVPSEVALLVDQVEMVLPSLRRSRA
jgi:hypothetical protein